MQQHQHLLRQRAGGDVAGRTRPPSETDATAHDASPAKSLRPRQTRSAAHVIALTSFFAIAAAVAIFLVSTTDARKPSAKKSILEVNGVINSSPITTYVPPSKEWLEGPRKGNVDIGITKQDIHNLIIAGAQSHDSFDSIISESVCSKNSPVAQTIPSFDLDAFATANVNLTRAEASQLIYRAIHENQYGPARKEAINRLQHWDEWLALASNPQYRQKDSSSSMSADGGIRMLDFECPSAKFLLFDGFTVPVGLGSNLRRWGNVDVFRTALSHQRVFLYVPGDRPNAFASCDRMDLQCSFTPMSPCVITQKDMDSAPVAPQNLDSFLSQNSDERIVRVKQKAGYSTSQVQAIRGRHGQIYGLARTLEGLRGKVEGSTAEFAFIDNLVAALSSVGDGMELEDVISAAAQLFITRPNRQMREIINRSLQDSFPKSFDRSKAVGMPIRASDKCKKEIDCIGFGNYMEQLHLEFSMYDMKRVVLTSEDGMIIKASEAYTEEHDEDFTFTTNKYDVTQGSGAYDDLPQSEKEHSKEDILASTMTSWAFQLKPGHAFLNLCSNFHVLIFDSIRFGCAMSSPASTKKQNITCNVGRG
mmetsp:Transcript_6580/g.18357  ORF Transcript_6580/g.18357 Transcript_6580/m.18357 type:complete len:590 (+) Transcript_6580:187-1956(+)